MDVFAGDVAVYAKEWTLPARKKKGWVHEVEIALREGEAIDYESDATTIGSGRVKFNIHSHEGRKVTYHADREDDRFEGVFVAPWKGKFYLMWENVSEDPAHLRVRARRHPRA